MNFNNKGLIILLVSVLVAVLMLIFTQTRIDAQTFKGSHDTSYIRHLWFYCDRGMTERRPDVPPFFRAIFCDCLLDKIRLTVDKSELEGMRTDERQKLMKTLTKECTKQQAEEVI